MAILLDNLDWSLAKLAEKSDLSYETVKNLYYDQKQGVLWSPVE